MKRIAFNSYRLALTCCLLAFCMLTANAETASELLNRVSSKISAAKSVNVQFKIDGSQTGELKISGKKFYVSAMGNTSWYNGKEMYTYNSSSKETTLFIPTKTELAESNPLYYVSGAQGNYDISFAPSAAGDVTTLILTPKRKKDSIKKVELSVSKKKLLPESIKIFTKSNKNSVIKITKLSLGESMPESTFIYPKSKYSKVKIIDLR